MKANDKVIVLMGHLKGKEGVLLAKNRCKIKGKRAVQIDGDIYYLHEFNLRKSP